MDYVTNHNMITMAMSISKHSRWRPNAGGIGVKAFGFHFDSSLPSYRKSRYIRKITILLLEYNMHLELIALAMSCYWYKTNVHSTQRSRRRSAKFTPRCLHHSSNNQIIEVIPEIKFAIMKLLIHPWEERLTCFHCKYCIGKGKDPRPFAWLERSAAWLRNLKLQTGKQFFKSSPVY